MEKINLENSGIDISSIEYDNNPEVFIEIEGVRVHSIGESIQDHISFQNKWGIKKDELTYKEYCFIKLYSQEGYSIVNEFFRNLPKVKDSELESFYKEYYIPVNKEIYKEKLIKGESIISDSEILGFIHDIQGRDSNAAGWTDASMKKWRTCMKGFMSDGGLATHEFRQMHIERPIMSQALIDFLKTEDYADIANILAGER